MRTASSATPATEDLLPPSIVHVALKCDDGVSTKIDPWRAGVPRHGSVEWRLTSGSSLEITPDDPRAWPFEISNPTGDKASPAQSGPMKDPIPEPGTVIRYTIRVSCEEKLTEAITVAIDPELIIT